MEKDNNLGIIDIDINKEMRDAYLQYSMSVIVGRALPDIRDGLKPVHRRILYAMHELNNVHNKPYKKSARIVGDVIGKYHPHGDVAVYESMVRMAQDFSLRDPLVDGQGNFGSVDGDSPAAQRYTEVRMTQLAEELLEDLEKETVMWGLNYDDSLKIPLVLPAKFPNLLVNGSAGIAVGMATNIPPHNLGEVIDACLKLIAEPDTTIDELIGIVPGPDFPTSAVISGRKGIHQAYRTGRGVISLKAVSEIVTEKNHDEIIVTEIPYQINKAKLIENMANLVKDKKIEGIRDIRDESSREGMRIVIVLKSGENSQIVLNCLYKFTQMQTSFGIIMLALDGRNQPRVWNLKAMLEAFIEHRRDVVTKRCVFELKKAEARAHILEGLRLALDQIDKVIKTIRASKEAKIAMAALQDEFEFSEIQAKAILEMRLQRLTGLEREKIINELKEIMIQIDWLKKVLSNISEIYKIIKEELVEIRERFATPRKTKIEEIEDEFDSEDLIASEEVIVSITRTGYIKRLQTDDYRVQARGGKGLKGATEVDSDYVWKIFSANTLSTILAITDRGRVYWLKVYKIPKVARTSRGRSVKNLISLSAGENIQAMISLDNFSDDQFLVMVTEKGIIKKSNLSLFKRPRTTGLIALSTELEDNLKESKICKEKHDIFLVTAKGQSIRFSHTDVRSMGRTARGVKGIVIGKGDKVVSMETISENTKDTILIVTANGKGKRTLFSEYRRQSRGGVGIIAQRLMGTDAVVGAHLVKPDDQVMVTTNNGQSIRMKVSDISIQGRTASGVKLIGLKLNERVTTVALLADDGVVEEK